MKEKLGELKDASLALQAIATVIAIVIGGAWTYNNFVGERVNHPRLQLSLEISDFKLTDKQNMLVVDERLTNVGNRLVRLTEGQIRVAQVLPMPAPAAKELSSTGTVLETEHPHYWPLLHKRPEKWGDDHIIEPNENDQIHHEFIIGSDIQVVTVISYISNPAHKPNKPLGWRTTVMYDLRKHAVISGGASKPIGGS
jgi:hypothetical protein